MKSSNQKKKMTLKQERFCHEYLIDFNGAQAAIRAGYSKKSARSIAQENLTKPDVNAYLSELVVELNSRSNLEINKVVSELKLIAFSDVRDVVEFKKNRVMLIELNPSVKELELDGNTIKLKLHDKVSAIKQLLEYAVLINWSGHRGADC